MIHQNKFPRRAYFIVSKIILTFSICVFFIGYEIFFSLPAYGYPDYATSSNSCFRSGPAAQTTKPSYTKYWKNLISTRDYKLLNRFTIEACTLPDFKNDKKYVISSPTSNMDLTRCLQLCNSNSRCGYYSYYSGRDSTYSYNVDPNKGTCVLIDYQAPVTYRDNSVFVTAGRKIVSSPVKNSSVTISVPPTTEGEKLDYNIPSNNFTTADPPIEYSISALPSGLTLNGLTITGTPVPGTAAHSPYKVSLVAKNAGGINSFPFEINIISPQLSAKNSKFEIPQVAVEKSSFTYTLPSNLFTPDDGSLTYSLGTLPDGLTFEGNTRTITGTPKKNTSNSSPYFLQLVATKGTQTATVTVELAIKPLIAADSKQEFSCNQGQDNWFYGFYSYNSMDLNNIDSSQFQLMPQCGPDNKGKDAWVTQTNSTKPELKKSTVMSLASDSQHPDPQWSVRRWKSQFDGQIEISGVLHKYNQGGDGTINLIYVNGGSPEKTIELMGDDNNNKTFSLSINVHKDDLIDFVTNPNATNNNDFEQFTVKLNNLT